MTVLTDTNIAGPYVGNGSTTTFDFSFRAFDSGDLQVILTDANGAETTLTLDTHYSVSIASDYLGGTVTYPLTGSPMSSTHTLSIVRVVDYTQGAAFQNQGGFYPKTHENAFDRATMQIQQLDERLSRAPLFRRSADLTDVELIPENGKFLAWAGGTLTNSAGTGADAGLRTDLADTDGSDLVGFIASGTGAVATNVASKLNQWVSAADFGLSTGATASVNAAAIHDAADEAYAKNTCVFIPGGSYACNPLTIPTRVSLVGPAYTAGNLNRQAARLDFTGLGANTKAITLGSDVTLQNLVISGPGDSTSGTYGVYGGLLASEALGSYTTLIGCTVEDFETNVALSRWINTIERCMIDDAIAGIRLSDQANATKIINNVITVGNSSGRKNIVVAGGIGIEITHNTSEAAFQHIVVQGGRKISINNNYFEQANGGFIDIEGSGTPAADIEMTVNLHDNNYNEYGASASTSTRYAIRVQRGNVSIHDETIGEYDSGANTGLRYGIRLGNIQTDGGFGGLFIGGGMRIGAHTPIEQAVIGTEQRKLITTPWSHCETITMSGSGWDTSKNSFDTPIEAGVKCLNFIRQASLFAQSALNADIAYMSLGYYSSSNLAHAYIQSNFNFGGTLAAGTRVIATDANYTTLGKSIFERNNARAFRVDRNQGSATSGSVMLSVEIGEIRYYNISIIS